MPKGPEKPRHERTNRTKKRLMVRYGVDKLDRMAFSKNISETGVFIHTNIVFKPGTMVQLQIEFPGRTVSHWAQVAWAKQVPPQLQHVLECGMGLRFIDPPSDWPAFYRSWNQSR